ncbi:MAG: hypothetical protein ACLFPR_03815 [Desulfococcaceae bacterium]
MNKGRRILHLFLTAPQTWMVVFILLALEAGFIHWFQPGWTVSAIAAGIGAFLLLLWPAVYARSDIFRRRYHVVPEALDAADLRRLLEDCGPAFRKPALECLALAERIREEFQGQAFLDDVDAVLQNLGELARNHRELLQRSQTFGTDQQRETMKALLHQQAQSVDGALVALKRLGGNLTLFDLRLKDQREIDGELKAINAGLQDAMKEVDHG